MAITRIKNNQITDSTITNAKIASGTITGGSLNPDLNYSGNLTVTGNLSVSGTTTVVDTVNTTIADPLLLLSRNASGTPTVDAGFVVERGSSTNVAFVWDESAGEFIAASTTEDGTTAGAITISAYSNLKVNVAKMDTLANQAGSASPKIAGLTATRVTFAGTDGVLSDDAGMTFASGTLSVGDVDIGGTTVETSAGNLTLAAAGGGVTTSDIVTITSATTSTSNSTGALVVTGGIATNENLNVGGDADIDGNLAIGGDFSVTGDLSATNLTLSGDIDAATGTIDTLDGVDASFTGNISAGGDIDATGDMSAANAVFSGDVDAATGTITTLDGTTATFTTGNITTVNATTVNGTNAALTGNITVGGTAGVTGNLTAGNISATTGVLTTGNITTVNATTLNGTSAALSAGLTVGTTAAITGNLTAGNISATTGVLTTGNITTVNATTLNGTNAALTGNITAGGTAAITGNLTAGNISATTGVLTTGNITTVNATTLNGTNAVLSGDIDAATGTIDTLDGVDASFSGNVTAGGDVTVTGDVSATDGNFSGDVIVSGNLTVDGTATYVNTVTTTVADPIMVIGGGADGAALTADDNKDRGVGFQWHNGDVSNGAKNGFFGFDDSTGRFTFVPVATITSEVVSGAKGDIDINEVFAVDGTFSGDVTADTLTVSTLNSTNLGLSGNLTVGGTAGFTGAMTGSDLTLSGDIDAATGTIATLDGTDASFSGNISAGGDIDATGDMSAANAVFSGDVDAATGTIVTLDGTTATFTTGNITTVNATTLNGTNAVLSGDIDAATGTIATLDGTDASFSGNISAAGDIDAATGTIGTLDGTTASFSSDISAGGDIDATGSMSATNMVLSGDIDAATGTIATLDGTNASFTGNVTAGGDIDATGDMSAANAVFSGDVDAATGTIVTLDGTTATFTTGNVTTVNGGTVNVSTLANITAATASTTTTTGALLVAGGAGIVGNINVGGAKSQFTNTTASTSSTTGAVVVAGGVGVAGALTVGNIQVDTQTISSVNTNGAVNIQPNGTGKTLINPDGNGSDTAIGGVNNANVIYVDASADNVGIKTSTPHAGASLHINGTDSLIIATGTTAQRPGTTQQGMLRFNSDTTAVEYYDGSEWTSLASDFTVIASQQADGDGSTVAFTLTETQTTASCIVSINGVVQLPTTAYSVSGTTLTFTEAPASGDKIEIRKITTTTTVTNLADNSSGYVAMFTESSGIDFYTGSASRTKVATIDNAGQLNLLATTDSTSTSTGALVVDGGAGVAGNLYVGGTIYGTATGAQYADLAENYVGDAAIEPGTVVEFGGDKEVTACTHDMCTRVAGVVSTAPAYLMNVGLEAEHVVAVAFTGRVPCKVVGPVRKGDMMVSAGNGAARAEADPKVGSIIGKALENFDGAEGVIEVVVGRY